MTCQQLRSHFEDVRYTAVPQADSAEIAAHAAICGACSHFVEEQQELATSLCMLRESGPQVPSSLDTTVLARYRAFSGEEMNSARQTTGRRRLSLIAAFVWTAAVVAAMIIAGAELRLFSPSEEIVTTPNRAAAPQTGPAPQTSAPPQSTALRLNASRRAPATMARSKRKAHAANPRIAGNAAPAVAVTNSASSLPVRFRSLMYCDALSCAGPMEMIRLQLPRSALSPAWTQSNDLVYADVLVGTDGIARGIRVVQ